MNYFRFAAKLIIAASTVLLLSGCGVKTVYVPVSSCPAPPVITMPELAVDRLQNKPETSLALKALAEDHIALRGELEQCIVVLDGYRKK